MDAAAGNKRPTVARRYAGTGVTRTSADDDDQADQQHKVGMAETDHSMHKTP